MARKKIAEKEKITLVKAWVKKKNVKKAAKEIAVIESKYN